MCLFLVKSHFDTHPNHTKCNRFLSRSNLITDKLNIHHLIDNYLPSKCKHIRQTQPYITHFQQSSHGLLSIYWALPTTRTNRNPRGNSTRRQTNPVFSTIKSRTSTTNLPRWFSRLFSGHVKCIKSTDEQCEKCNWFKSQAKPNFIHNEYVLLSTYVLKTTLYNNNYSLH